jgi:thymidylate kinase
MIVEFIGTPGSGKTTMVPVVQEYLSRKGFRAYSILEAARPFAQRTMLGKVVGKVFPGKLRSLALWKTFYIASHLNRAQFSRKNNEFIRDVRQHQEARPISKADRRHVLRWFIHLTGYYEFFNKKIKPDEVLIYDEGFVHRVVQMFASEFEEPDYPKVSKYLDSIPKPDLVVFTETPVETCIERVFSRGVWERFEKRDLEDTRRFIRNASEIVGFSVRYIRELGWKVVEIHNGAEDVTASKKKLQQLLSEQMS